MQSPDSAKDVDVEEYEEENRQKAGAEESRPIDVIPACGMLYLGLGTSRFQNFHIFYGV